MMSLTRIGCWKNHDLPFNLIIHIALLHSKVPSVTFVTVSLGLIDDMIGCKLSLLKENSTP